MSRTRSIQLLMLAVLLWGCDRGWPPQSQKMIEHFAEHQTEIEVLEARILKSEYPQVSSGGWERGSDVPPDWVGVVVELEAGRERTRVSGEAAVDWNEAFRDAGVWSVARYSHGTTFDYMVDFPKDVLGFSHYIHFAREEDSLVECREDFRDVRCGECGIHLDENWWILYRWSPKVVDPDLQRAAMDGDISWEEYEERDDELFLECLLEGARIIGIQAPAEENAN